MDVDEQDSGNEQRQSEWQKQAPIRYGFNEYAYTVKFEHVACNVWEISEPRSFEEALTNYHAQEWKAVADSEC